MNRSMFWSCCFWFKILIICMLFWYDFPFILIYFLSISFLCHSVVLIFYYLIICFCFVVHLTCKAAVIRSSDGCGDTSASSCQLWPHRSLSAGSVRTRTAQYVVQSEAGSRRGEESSFNLLLTFRYESGQIKGLRCLRWDFMSSSYEPVVRVIVQ